MPFEQPGVANIRARKAANEARDRRGRDGVLYEPPKGTLAHLVWAAQQSLTPEQQAEKLKAFRKREKELNAEAVRRHRCSECGADTLNYSHSFSCKWRGSGF